MDCASLLNAAELSLGPFDFSILPRAMGRALTVAVRTKTMGRSLMVAVRTNAMVHSLRVAVRMLTF
jgi:hypothetical protein